MRSHVALTLAVTAAFGTAHAFSYRDDFANYAPESDGSPAWDTGSVDWEVQGRVFTSTGRSKDSAILQAAPAGRKVFVEARLTLRETTSSGWKVAGLCVSRDAANFWHLALIEAPDKDGKRHFVELTEMLDGTWLAQTREGTRLSATESSGQGFDWQYGRAYHLTVELTARGITGSVTELDGTVRAKIGYAFDGRAVTEGRPGLTSGGFRSEFSSFSTGVWSEVPVHESKAEELPPYVSRGFPHVRGKATGFFRVEERDGRWWMIDPAGNAFFAIGTDHANWNVHWCEKLGYAPYHRNVEKRYGEEIKWAESTVSRLLSWGFNCLGVNSSSSVRYKGLAHMDILGMGTAFSERDWITPKTTWTGFPNVFSPKFRLFCEKVAKRSCAPRNGDPWLVGYFIDNELEWHAWTGGGPFADVFKLPAGNTARKALVEFFRERHATPATFNRAWDTDLRSLDDLLTMSPAPSARTDAARRDVRDWIRLLADRYFAVTTAAIRKYDPNHMVLGCRFAGGAPEILDIAGRYCDVFSVNCYRRVDLERGVMADGFEEFLADWHGKVKRPFIITEWSFPALDAGLPCKHGAGQRVPTQKDKAFAFTVFQKVLFSTPYVVGSNYFMWADEPELGISSTFPEDSNYGLVNVKDEVYEELTRAASQLHPLVYAIHSGQFADTRVRAAEDGRGFTLENAGNVDAGCKVTLWVDGVPREENVNLPAGASRTISPPAEAMEKPGAHLLLCQVEPHDRFIEKGMDQAPVSLSFFVPGTPWHEEAARGADTRVPLLVTNPSGADLADVPVSLRLRDVPGEPAGGGGVALVDPGTRRELPCQLDRLEGGDEVAFCLDALAARSAKALFLYLGARAAPEAERGVSLRTTGKTCEIDNGVLKLSKVDAASGNAFDRISLEGLELGRFTPLVWQEVGQNLWVGPDAVEAVETSRGAVRLVVDVTASRQGQAGQTKTAVDGEGRKTVRRDRARSYRTKYRFVIYPGRTWFTSRPMWIENTDAAPWRLAAYYHYLNSHIAGDATDDEPKGTYWEDSAAGACLGIVPGSPAVEVVFWKDKGGGQHPDAFRKVGVTLDPGGRHEKIEPEVYVLGVRGRKWEDAVAEIKGLGAVACGAFDPEKRPRR